MKKIVLLLVSFTLVFSFNAFAVKPVKEPPPVEIKTYVKTIHREATTTISEKYMCNEIADLAPVVDAYGNPWGGGEFIQYDPILSVSANCARGLSDADTRVEADIYGEYAYNNPQYGLPYNADGSPLQRTYAIVICNPVSDVPTLVPDVVYLNCLKY